MKKIFSIIVFVFVFVFVGKAQMPQVPQDPNVRIGHLDNGLTYYIRHNAVPEGKASYFMVQKVGSLQEEESQRGLAHLLEHLAFRGSEHFRKGELMKFVESNGASTNAQTSADNTLYYVSDLPTRAGVIDTCMLILKDWSNGISLTKKSIDEERDVVHNEYRLRNTGVAKIQLELMPDLYPGSKYGVRQPMGLMSVIDGCDPDLLREFYRKWYRPDNQAVVIVGDIDVDAIEKKIHELFDGIKVPANAAKIIPEPVPDNQEAIYAIGKDKEVPANMFVVWMKHDPLSKEEQSSVMSLVQKYIDETIVTMLNARYAEKVNAPECPFLLVSSTETDYYYSSTKKALAFQCMPKPGKSVEAYSAMLTEAKRVADFGFTPTEYERAKQEYLGAFEKTYAERDNMTNNDFSKRYINNYLSDEIIPSVEQEYQLMKMLIPEISYEMVNERAKEIISLNDKNFVVLVVLQEKDDATYPTASQLADAKSKVCNTQLEAYVDNVKQQPLMAQVPKAGSILKTTENKTLGYKTLTLSNGAKVILKKTDFKENEIVFSAHASQGGSGYPETKAVQLMMLGDIVETSGLGGFSYNELQKVLAGKQASLELDVSEYERSIEGSTTPKDIETFMQMIHLTMTDVTKDEKNFENFRNKIVTVLSNQSNYPEIFFMDSVRNVACLGSKFNRVPSIQDIKAISYTEALQTVKELFSNAKDFTFTFVGNIDEQTLLPLINTYIASLPNSGKTLVNKDLKMAKGAVKSVFTKAMATPNSRDTEMWYSEIMPLTQRNAFLTAVTGSMLNLRLFHTVREKLSASYSPQGEGQIEKAFDGRVRYAISGSATLNPEKVDVALPFITGGLKDIASSPNPEDLKKAKEIYLNKFGKSVKTNKYWLGVIKTFDTQGVDKHTGYADMINGFQPQDITDFINNVILKSGNHVSVLMNAVKE